MKGHIQFQHPVYFIKDEEVVFAEMETGKNNGLSSDHPRRICGSYQHSKSLQVL